MMISEPLCPEEHDIVSAQRVIKELRAEIIRLRADPNRLNLESVPSGWEFNLLSHTPHYAPDGSWQCVISRIEKVGNVNGAGPTPAAALADAVGRTNRG